MSDIQSQLAPGWSPVNIGITVVLFFIGWPLALLMVGYVLLGNKLGISLARPATFGQFFRRIKRAASAASTAFSASGNHSSGTPDYQRDAGGTPYGSTAAEQKLAEERDALARERAEFEKERQAHSDNDKVS